MEKIKDGAKLDLAFIFMSLLERIPTDYAVSRVRRKAIFWRCLSMWLARSCTEIPMIRYFINILKYRLLIDLFLQQFDNSEGADASLEQVDDSEGPDKVHVM